LAFYDSTFLLKQYVWLDSEAPKRSLDRSGTLNRFVKSDTAALW
jgi:hypothetical protein